MSTEQKHSIESLQKDPKFITTIKTFITYGTIIYVANVLVSMVLSVLSFERYYIHFNVLSLIFAIIVGAIVMAIAGAIFYFIYNPIRVWVKKTPFLAKYIKNMFSLFWKPFLVVIVISAVFTLLNMMSYGSMVMGMGGVYGGYAATGFGGLFVGWIIGLAVQVALYYWYAKNVSAKLEPLYPW